MILWPKYVHILQTSEFEGVRAEPIFKSSCFNIRSLAAKLNMKENNLEKQTKQPFSFSLKFNEN